MVTAAVAAQARPTHDHPPTAMTFYLGTGEPSWLARLAVPLFVSDRRLRHRRTLPLATCPWALDSAAYTTLARGERFDSPAVYAARIRRYRDEVGQLAWAALQDWMCEDQIRARTGLTVREHQARTIGSYLDLRGVDDRLPVIPVLQGYTTSEYVDCVVGYENAGVRLADAPVVGVGSICRRQSTADVRHILATLRDYGLGQLHGFGVKLSGLARYAYLLSSADSMAWSYAARRRGVAMPGCPHRTCQTCPRYALAWRTRTIRAIGKGSTEQLALFSTAAPARPR